MAHVVYVDLSAKAEQWVLPTAIAVSDQMQWAYWVPARTKQRLRRLLTERHGTKNLQYRVLALLVYVAVRDQLGGIRQIVIDRDYTGPRVENTIKNLLLQLLRHDRPDVTAGFIRVENVKGSRADRLAREVYEAKRKPDRTISFKELLAVLEQ